MGIYVPPLSLVKGEKLRRGQDHPLALMRLRQVSVLGPVTGWWGKGAQLRRWRRLRAGSVGLVGSRSQPSSGRRGFSFGGPLDKIRKAIVAAFAAGAAALGTALPDGLNEAEIAGVLAAAIVAGYAVYKVKNAS